jgi:hypothetical protein
MSTVSPSGLGALLLGQRDSAAKVAMVEAAAPQLTGTGTTGGGDTPAVVLDLSEAAKAMMQQAQQGQMIADMVQASISPGSGPSA